MCTKGTGPHLQRTDGLELLSATIACSCEVSAPSVHRRWHASSRLILPAMMRGKLTCDSSSIASHVSLVRETWDFNPAYSELAGLGPMRLAPRSCMHIHKLCFTTLSVACGWTHDAMRTGRFASVCDGPSPVGNLSLVSVEQSSCPILRMGLSHG